MRVMPAAATVARAARRRRPWPSWRVHRQRTVRPLPTASPLIGASSANDILQQFLQSLKDSLSASSPTSYGATGTFQTGSNSTASFSALLIDYQT
jgi:hypothetical protein